jgi:hypothetical protein
MIKVIDPVNPVMIATDEDLKWAIFTDSFKQIPGYIGDGVSVRIDIYYTAINYGFINRCPDRDSLFKRFHPDAQGIRRYLVEQFAGSIS